MTAQRLRLACDLHKPATMRLHVMLLCNQYPVNACKQDFIRNDEFNSTKIALSIHVPSDFKLGINDFSRNMKSQSTGIIIGAIKHDELTSILFKLILLELEHFAVDEIDSVVSFKAHIKVYW